MHNCHSWEIQTVSQNTKADAGSADNYVRDFTSNGKEGSVVSTLSGTAINMLVQQLCSEEEEVFVDFLGVCYWKGLCIYGGWVSTKWKAVFAD